MDRVFAVKISGFHAMLPAETPIGEFSMPIAAAACGVCMIAAARLLALSALPAGTFHLNPSLRDLKVCEHKYCF